MKYLLVALMVLLSDFSLTYELTEQYQKEKTGFVKAACAPYQACTASVSTYHYYQVLPECRAAWESYARDVEIKKCL
ncbi:hypothetical protein [Microbulbifer spongiae]|uniref:Uncharacterized protein n=1 Tax=Microbulbifer spongiae TaxID=2944933 RepID=A0ABY9E9X0_9GAMM|nr:hypothetical protein [Microbulbifer sp. MI-G]WKD49813.1 hypothetical protein M8T91_18300 [Microbulbifer sp. MI-G]